MGSWRGEKYWGKREDIQCFTERVKSHFTGRMAKNWGTLLFFVQKVCLISFIPQSY